ncbi:MAG: glycosyltransferase [Bacteroidales bacterium]|nr:glycosyltransferase [Bacteroidales bacterium]
MKKKIIVVGTAYPFRGGIANFNERLAREFLSEGHDVEILTFTLQYPSFLFPGKTQFSDSPAPRDLSISRWVNSCNPFNWISVGRHICRMKPDLVIIGFWHPFMAPCLGTIAWFSRRNHFSKVISVLHNAIPHERHFGDSLLAKYFVNAVDGVVAMSDSVIQDICQLGFRKPKVRCIHPLYDNFGVSVGREESLSHLGLNKDSRYLLFFGLIRDYKGLDWLLDSFAKSGLVKKNVKLIVAGEFYGDGEKYRKLANELGVNEAIVWQTNFVPNEEVRYYFGAADLVVQPYKSATQSGVTQIAYHFEKPMLVTRVGGLAEIVPDGKVGYVVSPNSQDIADALCDFYDNNRLDSFRQGLVEEKGKYAWSNMTHAILSLM